MRKIYIAAIVLLAVVIGGAWVAYRNVMETTKNAYAVWWVADMVIAHLEADHDDWPKGWEELTDDYETCVKKSGRPWTFEELCRRVVVDWNADPMQMATLAQNGEPLRVIWLADGTTSHWEHQEPNEMLSNYFRRQKSK